jgi:aryl-alcohol dehydrogenase-like predicted oxidoreductase
MEYRNIPNIEKPLSRIVMGTLNPMTHNEDCFEMLDAVYETGINVFDTAAAYGDAEASLGRWIRSRGLRDKVVILTKGANSTAFRSRCHPFDILSDIHSSFAKLGTDYIDVYILHRDDSAVPVEDIIVTLDRLHKEGRIGIYGGSNWSMMRTMAANEYAVAHGLMPFMVCSPSYSLVECIGDPFGGSVTISGEANRSFRQWLRAQNMAVFAYSSLGRGFLSGKIKSWEFSRVKEVLGDWTAGEYAYPVNFDRLKRAEHLAEEKGVAVSQIAYAWLMAQDLNVFGLTAPGTKEHLRQIVEALNIRLSDQELKWLNLEVPELSPNG